MAVIFMSQGSIIKILSMGQTIFTFTKVGSQATLGYFSP